MAVAGHDVAHAGHRRQPLQPGAVVAERIRRDGVRAAGSPRRSTCRPPPGRRCRERRRRRGRGRARHARSAGPPARPTGWRDHPVAAAARPATGHDRARPAASRRGWRLVQSPPPSRRRARRTWAPGRAGGPQHVIPVRVRRPGRRRGKASLGKFGGQPGQLGHGHAGIDEQAPARASGANHNGRGGQLKRTSRDEHSRRDLSQACHRTGLSPASQAGHAGSVPGSDHAC